MNTLATSHNQALSANPQILSSIVSIKSSKSPTMPITTESNPFTQTLKQSANLSNHPLVSSVLPSKHPSQVNMLLEPKDLQAPSKKDLELPSPPYLTSYLLNYSYASTNQLEKPSTTASAKHLRL